MVLLGQAGNTSPYASQYPWQVSADNLTPDVIIDVRPANVSAAMRPRFVFHAQWPGMNGSAPVRATTATFQVKLDGTGASSTWTELPVVAPAPACGNNTLQAASELSTAGVVAQESWNCSIIGCTAGVCEYLLPTITAVGTYTFQVLLNITLT